jgi:hypothetical protein
MPGQDSKKGWQVFLGQDGVRSFKDMSRTYWPTSAVIVDAAGRTTDKRAAHLRYARMGGSVAGTLLLVRKRITGHE